MDYLDIKQGVVVCTIKLQKLPCFSAVLLYTKLPLVLYANNPNIIFIPVTIPFHIYIFLPCFIINICFEMHNLYAYFVNFVNFANFVLLYLWHKTIIRLLYIDNAIIWWLFCVINIILQNLQNLQSKKYILMVQIYFFIIINIVFQKKLYTNNIFKKYIFINWI